MKRGSRLIRLEEELPGSTQAWLKSRPAISSSGGTGTDQGIKNLALAGVISAGAVALLWLALLAGPSPAGAADAIVDAMRKHPLGRNAARIGSAGGRPGVFLRTTVGGLRPVLMLEGVQLPRIC